MGFIEKIKRLLRFKPKKYELIAVVLLLKRRAELTDEMLHTAIVRAWGRDTDESQNEYVVNEKLLGVIRFESLMLLFNNVPRPYVDDKDQMAESFREQRLRKITKEHTAWMSFDLMHPARPDSAQKAHCYRRMCRLAAEFIDENCLAIYLTETGTLRPHDGRLIGDLTSDQPLELIPKSEQVAVVGIEEDDADLKAAVAEARTRWPEFVEAFERRKPDQMFSVKAPFPTSDDSLEWIWVNVASIEGGLVAGELGNRPVNVPGLQEGDFVVVNAQEIGDWCFSDGEQMVGAFTLPVLGRRLSS
jgi:uncharacterized protein YegJ (DUF2314 family)